MPKSQRYVQVTESKPKHVKTKEPLSWWWWWEIGSLTLSMACMALIIAILIKSDGLVRDEWPLSIEPNSLIAVFTTIGRSCMMVAVAACLSQLKWRYFDHAAGFPLSDMQTFEEASRGPWGAFMFLGKIRHGAIIAFLLSFATVLALGFDPSAQQVLGVSTRNDTRPSDEARIGQAKVYVSKALSNHSITTSTIWNNARLKVEGSIVDGALGAVPKPEIYCPGNAKKCTWGQVSTLGLCWESRKIEPSTNPVRCKLFNNYEDMDRPGYNVTKVSCDDLGFETETSVYLSMTYKSNINQTADIEGFYFILSEASHLSRTNKSGLVFSVARRAQYTLYWCEQTFGTVEAIPGALQEPNSGVLTTTPLTHLKTTFKNKTDISPEIRYNSDDALEIYQSQNWLSSDNAAIEYVIAENADQMIWTILSKLFSTRDFMCVSLSNWTVQDRINPAEDIPLFTSEGGLVLTPLLGQADNLDDIFYNVAATVSAQVRASGDLGDNENLTMMTGYVTVTEVYMHARWGWMTLPLGLTLLTAGLLIFTVVLTRDLPLYKSSPLPLMRYDVRGWDRNHQSRSRGSRREAEILEKSAEAVVVRLEKDELGNVKGFERVN
ncbi:hypothetical protein QBC38DRAFT_414702 [Podospora fimiseda]|uniref:Uncharacterized protein n=1 Tax=Podospora fimiseda TaxID=252190 RepID=A0AAN7BRU7_9PEZI|nr:hypothetical protein QBC38DRAFT_414702 [Podospora fimiseda]